MSDRYPTDPFALPNRPDVAFTLAGADRPAVVRSPLQRLRLAVLALAAFVVTVTGVAALLFLPVLLHELMDLQAVQRHGEVMLMSRYGAHLMSLFLGTVVVSGALVSFALAVVLSSQRSRVLTPVVRRRKQERGVRTRPEITDVLAV
ncbi:hypothetical protein GWI72_01200 [Microvirga tunisiensis]|uniref:Uncharacterized protein n=2 Tax=Pannonibacter tanglangensis TaxID=2750084 RepID=A0ABW9ZFM3_9HYPH|nr:MULTISPECIES: hypothetical protein [unclassified Pannonibacter]NBN63241.1 hypothetical protein [Pannonibacter sp. XCT-34]NBN76879.1 hypothetical protein [Pannonibacter sp. XCT-53]